MILYSSNATRTFIILKLAGSAVICTTLSTQLVNVVPTPPRLHHLGPLPTNALEFFAP